MDNNTFEHQPVLLQECLDGLRIDPAGIYIDGTLGGAGHASKIAAELTTGQLYGIDQDPEAIIAATARLAPYSAATVLQGNYRDAKVLTGLPEASVSGILLDLGVSSHQIDRAQRGFSYHSEGPLDMRMSGAGQSAADLIQTLTWQQLADILRDYGEEPYAVPIAKKIVQARQTSPITSTLVLSEVVASAVPASVRRKEKHPARRTFQALRIAVNDELGVLEEGLTNLFELLAPGGRFCIITFHSLEDRIVKRRFASWQQGCICPPDFPQCICGRTPRARGITKKPIVASEEACAQNRRARSAKLRILEKLES